MASEKTASILALRLAAGPAMLAGASLQGVALAALKPIAAKTRANLRRLSQGGRKMPG